MFPISNIFIKTSMTMILFFREKTLVLQERFGSSVPDNKKHLSAHHHVKHKRHFGWKTELWATRWPIDRSLWKSSLLHDNFGKKSGKKTYFTSNFKQLMLKLNWVKGLFICHKLVLMSLSCLSHQADFPAVFFHISHWYLSWNTAGGGDCI